MSLLLPLLLIKLILSFFAKDLKIDNGTTFRRNLFCLRKLDSNKKSLSELFLDSLEFIVSNVCLCLLKRDIKSSQYVLPLLVLTLDRKELLSLSLPRRSDAGFISSQFDKSPPGFSRLSTGLLNTARSAFKKNSDDIRSTGALPTKSITCECAS